MEEIKNKNVLFVVGAIFLLILIIGASLAYFQIVANNNATNTTISGEGQLVGQATLSTNVTELKLNMTAEIMHKDNVGKVYYATPTGEGIESSEVTDGNGRYTLATANVTESDVAYDCTYAYDISATTSKEITDGSDESFIVLINDGNFKKTYTLKQLLTGVTHTGKITNLQYGTDKKVTIEAYIVNTYINQNDLSGNEFTITITPKSGEEGFSCDLYTPPRYFYVVNDQTDLTNKKLYNLSFFPLVKVSDEVLLKEDLYGATFSYSIATPDEKLAESFVIGEDVVINERNYYNYIHTPGKEADGFALAYFVFEKIPSDYYSYESDFNGLEPGVYIICIGGEFSNLLGPDVTFSFSLASPHLEPKYSLSSDTDISNMTKIPHPQSSDAQLVKVSSDTLSLEEIKSSVAYNAFTNGDYGMVVATDDIIEKTDDYLILYGYNGNAIGVVIAYNPFEKDGLSISEPGIYLPYYPSQIEEIGLIVP